MERAFIILAIAICGAIAFTEDIDTRITFGNDAAISNFPYSVSLQRTSLVGQPTRGHRCGGALFTYQHVLTAASCLYDYVQATGAFVQIVAAEHRVFAGAALLTADDSTRVRTIANFSIRDDYIQPPASLNNIAIITLTSPFPNTTIQPIPLPVEDFNPPDFTLCQIASWGSTTANELANPSLRFTNKYVYGQDLCTTIYNQMPTYPNIFNTMVCAASFDIVSSGCNGDLGIPLVCSGGLTGIMIQTNACAVSSYPEIYTRVSNYTAWIRTISGSSTIRPELTLFAILAIITATFIRRV